MEYIELPNTLYSKNIYLEVVLSVLEVVFVFMKSSYESINLGDDRIS